MYLLAAALLAMGLTACAAPLLARRFDRAAGYPLAVAFGAVGALLATRAPEVMRGGTVRLDLTWVPALDVAFRLRMDGLSMLFAGLVLGVGALVLSYCARYLDHGDHRRLYTLLVAFATAMLGVVLADDLVVLFVFWELTTVCSFLLIGSTGSGAGTTGGRAATRALVVTGGGGLALLAAVVLAGHVTGTTDLSAVLAASDDIRASPYGTWIAVLVVLAAFTKSAQVPFHFWLPDAMVALTPVSAYLHAATLVKGGVYLLLRFSPPFAGTPFWTTALVTAGLTTAVFGAVVALRQHDLKALLAYSTVSQLGWIVTLIGVGTPTALAVAALHTFAHALFKATLFMLVGIIDREAGSRDIRDLSGLYRVMPVTAALTALAALSMAGLPPFLGFVSKEEAFYAFLELTDPVWAGPFVAGVAVVSAALTFAYGFRILWGAFGGRTVQRKLYDPSWAFLLPAAVPAVASLVLGLSVSLLDPLVNRTVQDTLLRDGDAELALWHGLTPALFLSLVTFAVGTALFLARDPVDRWLQARNAPLRGNTVLDRLIDATIAVGARVGAPARSGLPANHLLPVLACVLALGVVGAAVLPSPAGTMPPAYRPGDWAPVALLAVAVAATALVRNRVAAFALLGVVGLVVGGWFALLGAPDLALTQVLVEILTVVVAVLVLRRLPGRFVRTSRPRAAVAGVTAVLCGLVAGGATLAMTSRRGLSPTGAFLLERGPELSGGTNVVNTVLVDFRGLDTMGEAAVLAVVALGLLTLLRSRRPLDDEQERPARALVPGAGTGDEVILRTAAALLGPVFVVASLLLLLRGHYEPGGGFIAALVGGAGIAVHLLPKGRAARPLVPPLLLVGSGLVVCVLSGLVGFVGGSFLQPLRSYVLGQSLTTSLLFDVGIYLCVVGFVVAAMDRLAEGRSEHQARLVDDGIDGATVVRRHREAVEDPGVLR